MCQFAEKDKEPSGPEETSGCCETDIATRQFLSLNCLAITLTAGVILSEEKMPSLVGESTLGGILGDDLGEGNCESKIVSRQWGRLFLPRDIKMSRRAPLGKLAKKVLGTLRKEAFW